MSVSPHLSRDQSQIKLDDESGRALLAESPLEPPTSTSQSPDRIVGNSVFSGTPKRPPHAQVKLPPINSNISSPSLLPLKKGLGKKAALADISSSPVKPAELFQVNNLLKMNAFVNWEKLRDYVFAHKVTGQLNVLLDEKARYIARGKTVVQNEVVVYRPLWVRFKTFYFDPESWFIVIWGFLFELATIYFVFVYSYQMAFHGDVSSYDTMNIIGTCVDAFFVVTVILNFFIALKKSDGTLITNKEVIVRTYLATYFLFDVITLIPFEMFCKQLCFIRLLRVVHLSTFFRHMNEFTDLIVPYFVEGLAIIKISDFIGSLATVSLLFALIFHFFACIWIALGFPLEPDEKTWFDNISGIGFFDKNEDLVTGGNFKVYVCSLFQVAQTFSTIGYGNYYGFATREYLFSIVLLFFGILLFVFSFEKVKSIIGSFNEEEKRENEEADELESWQNMIERTIINHKDVVNVNLIHQIQAVLNYRVEADWQELFIDNEQFRKLDYKSAEKVLDIGLKKFKEKFYILFKDISDPLIHLTVIQSDSRLFVPGEEIVQKGKHFKGLFLILRGTVLLAGPSKEDCFTRLSPGSFFGEMSLTKDRKNPMYIISESEVNCLFIKKEAFEELAGKFPKDMEKLKALAYYRYKHFLYQKHQHQLDQMNSKKKIGSDLDLLNSPERDPLILGGSATPEKVFKEDHIAESPEKLIEEQASGSEKKLKLDEEEVIHYNKISKKAESQARKLKRLLSIDQEDIELAENSTDSEGENVEEVEDDSDEDDDGGDDEDEDSSVNDDELNSSDIYPLEMKNHLEEEEDGEGQEEKNIHYMEERIMFMQNKLTHLKKKFHDEMQIAIKRQRYCAKRLLKTETLKPFTNARSPTS